MPIPEFRKRTIEDYVRVRDEMGLGTGVSNIMNEYGMSKHEAHQCLQSLHGQGVVRYHAADHHSGKKTAELLT
jgi:DNA-binding IclR family transcriptional regulator